MPAANAAFAASLAVMAFAPAMLPRGRLLLAPRHAARTTLVLRTSESEGQADSAPLRVEIKAAGNMGFGAFAAEAAIEGSWVCQYVGELLTLDQVLDRYADDDPEYLFSLGDGARLYLDGQRGTHASRYVNHHQNGSLVPRLSLDGRRVDFFASRDIAPGEELTFDCASPHVSPPSGAPTYPRHPQSSQTARPTGWARRSPRARRATRARSSSSSSLTGAAPPCRASRPSSQSRWPSSRSSTS